MPRASSLLRFAALGLLVAFLVAPQRFAPLFAPLTQYGAPPRPECWSPAPYC